MSKMKNINLQSIYGLTEEWRSMAAEYRDIDREAEADIYEECAEMLEAWIDEI